MKTIGDNIREIRSQLKLTQNEFAKALGYTERNVGNWEHGRSVPTVYTIKKCMKFLVWNMMRYLILNWNKKYLLFIKFNIDMRGVVC